MELSDIDPELDVSTAPAPEPSCDHITKEERGIMKEAILDLLIRRDPVFHSNCDHAQQRDFKRCTRCLGCGKVICELADLKFLEKTVCCSSCSQEIPKNPDRTNVNVECVGCGNVLLDGGRFNYLFTYKKIDFVNFEKKLKDGDEVAFHRAACSCCVRCTLPTVFHHVIYSEKTQEYIGLDLPDDSPNDSPDKKTGCCSAIGLTGKAKEKIVIGETNTCCNMLTADDIYVIEYPECFDGAYVGNMARMNREVQARNKNPERKKLKGCYPCSWNCEHFARDIKTGKGQSSQISNLFGVLSNYGLFVILKLLLAVLGLTVIELEVPDDPVAARNIENYLIYWFCSVYGLMMVIFTVSSNVRQFMGYSTCCPCSQFRRNLGLYIRVSVDAAITWMLPMMIIILLRLVDWPPSATQWTDVAVMAIVTILGVFVCWPIGRFMGRLCEQCVTRCG